MSKRRLHFDVPFLDWFFYHTGKLLIICILFANYLLRVNYEWTTFFMSMLLGGLFWACFLMCLGTLDRLVSAVMEKMK